MGNHHAISQKLQANLYSCDRRVQLKDVKRLCKMCDDESMRDEIVQAGGVQALLRLCESCADQDTTEENMVVALRASKALYSLSSRLDVAGVLSDFGMGTLEGLARNRQNEVLMNTIGIIERVLQRIAAPVRCLEAGVLRPLALLLQRRPTAHRALALIADLSAFPSAQLQIVHLHCLPFLVAAFDGPAPVLLGAITTLTNVAAHSAEFRRAIIQAGALNPLLQLMLHAAENDELPFRAASAVCVLAGAADERETRLKVKETVTFYPFLILATSGSPRVLNAAARGLSVVLDSDQEWLNVVHIHGLGFLVALLDADDIVWLVYVLHRIRDLAAQQFLCQRCDHRTKSVRWHCHQCETDYCRQCYLSIVYSPDGDGSGHDKAHEVAVFQEDLKETFIEQGVLRRLADSVARLLAVTPAPAPLTELEREYVVVALSILELLASKEIAQIALMDTVILPVLQLALTGGLKGPLDFVGTVRLRSLSILSLLCGPELNTDQLSHSGLLCPVMAFIHDPLPEVQRPAVQILARLGPALREDGSPLIFGCPDGVGMLVNLAYTDDDVVQAAFVRCVVALAMQNNPDIAQAMVAEGVLERLYYYLTVADLSLQMRAECVAVLRRLQVFDFAQVLLSDDWLLVLIELALRHERQLTDPEDLLALMATLLSEVSGQAHRRSAVVTPDTVTVLDKCCQSADQETWCTAAKCLLNISYFDDASDISPDVCTIMLRTLTRLAYRTPRDEADRILLRTVSACFANVAAQQPLKGQFDQPAVNAAISLAGTQDQIVQLNAVRCLKNLTFNGPLMVRESNSEATVEQAPLTLRCHMADTTVLLSVARGISFTDLMRVLTEEYKHEVGIQYHDFAGELLTIASERSLDAAKAQHEQRCKDLPAHHRVFDLFLSLAPEPPAPLSGRISPTVSFNSNGLPSSSSNSLGLPASRDIDFTSPSAPRRRIRWKRGNFLGRGAFAMVYQALNLETGQLMAVKQIDMSRDRSAEETLSFEKEIELLQRFSHRNIVQYLGAQRDGNRLDIFLQYIPGGSIAGLLEKYGRFPERVTRGYARQILQGLSYLHRNGIVHRDIKGANILVMDDGVIKLADFGASRKILELTGEPTQNKSILGTPGYMAPEVIQKRVFSEKSDVWSVGATVYEMYCGSRPYSELSNPYAIMFHVIKAGPPTIPGHVDQNGAAFLRRCFQLDPDLRPSVDELLEDPFLDHLGSPASSVCSDHDECGCMETVVSMLTDTYVERDPRQDTLGSTLGRTFGRESASVIPCPYACVCNAEPFPSVDALHEHLSQQHITEQAPPPQPRPAGPLALAPVSSSLDPFGSGGQWSSTSFSVVITPSPGGTPTTARTPSSSSPLVASTPTAGTPLSTLTPNTIPHPDSDWLANAFRPSTPTSSNGTSSWQGAPPPA